MISTVCPFERVYFATELLLVIVLAVCGITLTPFKPNVEKYVDRAVSIAALSDAPSFFSPNAIWWTNGSSNNNCNSSSAISSSGLIAKVFNAAVPRILKTFEDGFTSSQLSTLETPGIAPIKYSVAISDAPLNIPYVHALAILLPFRSASFLLDDKHPTNIVERPAVLLAISPMVWALLPIFTAVFATPRPDNNPLVK